MAMALTTMSASILTTPTRNSISNATAAVGPMTLYIGTRWFPTASMRLSVAAPVKPEPHSPPTLLL